MLSHNVNINVYLEFKIVMHEKYRQGVNGTVEQ